jgi:hypothetical protein
MTMISSRVFNQDVGKAKKAAENGPVIISERGRPSHVLMLYADYEKLAPGPRTVAAALAQKEVADFEFEPPRMGDTIIRPIEFD